MNSQSPVEAIFFAALEKGTAEERSAYLAEACGTDANLRQRVERLLQAQPRVGSFLEQPAANPIATVDEVPLTEQPGTVIGPYKLMEQIGEGGMGLVFVAEQHQPVRRKVALKVIKPGMDTRDVIARFEAERQALALMDHPNIARVLDAGATDSGRPYFVMELVRGVPISRFCDENRLTPRERLELFVSVCHAVQHAHQKGIIHRDLKPSNVLVTLHDGTPVPKVIDFGVAKAIGQQLTERTVYTRFLQMVGTPLYMSPEQAEMSGLDIDTRTDVYALGVLLYELLTGSTPFDQKRIATAAFDEIRRIIREEEPPKPSTRLSQSGERLPTLAAQRKTEPEKLAKLFRGELDWIVMKCLDKDRTRRYETANGLARDIQRYLADEPVEAGPPSTTYRLQKFARKYKKPLAVAAAFALLLVLGSVVSTWQAVRATLAEADATEQRDAATVAEQEARAKREEAEAASEQLRLSLEQRRRLLYAAQMNVAHQTWESGGLGRVLELLEHYRGEPDLLGFEWHYLRRLCATGELTLRGHTDGVRRVAFSPDGRYLASGDRSGTVQIWEAGSGKLLRTLPASGRTESILAFHPDGKHMVRSVRAEHPDPGQLANAATQVLIWDWQTGRQVGSFPVQDAASVAISPDGKLLAVGRAERLKDLAGGGPGIIEIRDWSTRAILRELKGHTGAVRSLAWSTDSRRLVSGGPARNPQLIPTGGEVIVWDVPAGQCLQTMKGHRARVYGVAFSPNGRHVASASMDATAKVWDVASGQAVRTLEGHNGYVFGVTFSPDGHYLATANSDQFAKLWDARTGQELHTYKGHTNMVSGVAFSPDGQRLASASADKTVKIWPVQTAPVEPKARTLHAHELGLRGLALSRDDRCLATVSEDRTVKLWDLATGQLLRTLGEAEPVSSVAFSPDGERLAFCGQDYQVRLWNVRTGALTAPLAGHRGLLSRVAFHPQGRLLASGSLDRTVRLWDTETGTAVHVLEHTASVWGVALSPDGRSLASASEGGQAKVWDVATGQERHSLAEHEGTVVGVAFSPEGGRLATGATDGNARLWDLQTGQLRFTLRGHAGPVIGLAFTPDGKRLATASGDKTVKLWDVATGQETLTLRGHQKGVWDVAFTHDGHRLLSCADDGTVKIWDATPLPEKP